MSRILTYRPLLALVVMSSLGLGATGCTPNLGQVTQLTAGSSHTCALISNGTVRCWGSSSDGELGNGVPVDAGAPAQSSPVQVVNLGFVTQIAAGGLHTCAVLGDGTIRCWGENIRGELGNGSNVDSSTSVQPTAVTGATQVTAGLFHTCALINDGTVRCWGKNSDGQLGDGTSTDRSTAVAVSGVSGATQISAGDDFTCARINDGTVRCWGLNADGQLGDGNRDTNSLTPVAVSGLSGVRKVAAGSSHTCAIVVAGNPGVKCWGINHRGELGHGSISGDVTTPIEVALLYPGGPASVVDLAAGGDHTCALVSDATVRCWGLNDSGELGDGSTASAAAPVLTGGLANATQVTTGTTHSCKLINDGTVACWGGNSQGQVGDGTTTGRGTPVNVVAGG